MTTDVLKISQDHVWVRPGEDGALLGLTDFAAEALGKIIYVQLPEVGEEVVRGEPFAAVESAKANVELIAPISGNVLRVNGELEDRPDLVNEDSFSTGWIALLSIKDPAELEVLMARPDYDFFVTASE
ncbi:MAG: glycine cleavage system protein H [Syntrophobacteria bacterium]